MKRGAWLIVLAGLLFIPGCAESAAARTHPLTINTHVAASDQNRQVRSLEAKSEIRPHIPEIRS